MLNFNPGLALTEVISLNLPVSATFHDSTVLINDYIASYHILNRFVNDGLKLLTRT